MTTYDVTLALAMTAFLLGAAGWDRRTGQVPNKYVLPVLVAAGLRAALVGQWLFALAGLVIWAVHRLHVYGGGDAKLLMVVVAAYPTGWMMLALCGVVVLVVTPYVVWQHRHDWRSAVSVVQARLAEPGDLALGLLYAPDRHLGGSLVRLLPTAADLERAPRATWVLALTSIICLWLDLLR